MFSNQTNHSTPAASTTQVSIDLNSAQPYYTTTTTSSLKLTHHSPTCIVIGCKNGNGFSTQSVKYYQVPSINPNENSNSIARQWYINTLREDLLDFILGKSVTTCSELSTMPLPHFVCIEHFDEESFMLTTQTNETSMLNSQEQIMILKEDAVPSLFEIEVFQKMIAHQEQIALNQQKLIQLNQQHSSNGLMNGQHQPQKTSIIQTSVPTKRARMDPDTRAALIQRVPKAVKRTSLLNMAIQQTTAPTIQPQIQQIKPVANSSVSSPSPLPPVKAQKAVKHTMPRHLLNNANQQPIQNNLIEQTIKNESISTKPIQLQSQQLQQQQQQSVRVPKAVKHTSANILLPPPIMQSTKRVNKAIKHTGGGSNAYYQSLNKPLVNSQQQLQQQQQQPLTQLNLNNLNSDNKQIPLQPQPHQPLANKIPMTTTYVYKRILQQPEIDLNLECEDEEIILVSAPASPVSVRPQTPVAEPLSVSKDSLKKEEKQPLVNSSSVAKSAANETKKEALDDVKLRKAALKSVAQELAKTDAKQVHREINTTVKPEPVSQTKQAKLANSKTCLSANKKASSKKKDSSSETSEETSELDDEEINVDDDEEEDDENNEDEEDNEETNAEESDDDDDDDEDYEDVKFKKALSRRSTSLAGKNVNLTASNYSTVLAKFYARSHGDTSEPVSTKRAKAKVPKDLIVGNYPAKCNVCNLILDNNIELTSHICSHLESGGSSSANNTSATNDPNTYISPFDAVTTTCGVCDTTFSQPFDLIKHLDQKHMKQLNEYKCRICERQHSKFSDLIEHLNTTHVSQEMPYRCDACGFRTSFYADAIYHIKKEHKSTLRHFCPYCLKSLVLPYNEKQGYVQCNLFYSHLITHFNKHENDMLLPSKCKHCHKCILHVRYMKEHLNSDHTSHPTSSTTCSTTRKTLTESNTTNIKGNKSKLNEAHTQKKSDIKKETKQTKNAQQVSTKRNGSLSSAQTTNTTNTSLNLRKRRRSTVSETTDAETPAQITLNKEKIYEFNDDESSDRLSEIQIKTEQQTVAQSNENGTTTTTTTKTRGRRSSNTLNRSKVQTPKPEENPSKRARLSFTKNDIELALLTGPPYKRKQKALKQTTIKKNLVEPNKSFRRPSFDDSMRTFLNSLALSQPKQPSSPEIITATLAGNVKFNYNKNKFKCVECGDTDLKSHFRNDYTCHQCRYNTNCSNSFEYHLHGHLVSKRVALWNKVIKIRTEEYKCPCGFYINSTVDNNLNANTGNKVAAHLMKCEYKFCKVNIDEEEEEKKTSDETIIVKDHQDDTIETLNESSVLN